MCGICGNFEACADSCGVPVCSEACDHESQRRHNELETLRARVAELERDARIGQLVRRRLADVTSEHGYATVSLRDLCDIDSQEYSK